ncbi:exopolysaccharide biosynthesis polyprenyl glycosylphosphotransferase [Nocardia sp. NBC_01503]|uniref:exopolysaccharide biosynthesis polyprenyl glycosylphosphotransferase n=1 Tax=Nocardia sp. NBC_01503 TaxID=2975997 RepID=UPI002E7AF74B|nr:exopolysaccharide biosynthesis polyprenyl glycosylphosphotransferase [Nocardia sp. NBC_01503]WTL31840.1 exopolysaccharide biosynthesis polyprenyl glycosylphosphotransferase [Nocardia sp. NBC_01503]
MSFEISAGRIVRGGRFARPVPRTDHERRQSDYARRVGATDLATLGIAVAIAQAGCVGESSGALSVGLCYTALSLVLVAAWSVGLTLAGTRTLRAIGGGTEESRQVVAVSLKVFGAVATASMMLDLGISRSYLIVALLLGGCGLLVERALWRGWVARRRARGAYRAALLVVGNPEAAQAMAATFARDPGQGYEVIGVCAGDGGPRTVLAVARATGAEAVAVTRTDTLERDDFRSLAWELDELGIELLVTPSLVGIAGTRLTHRIVADMPVLRVAKPRYGRSKSIRKSVFDFCFALIALAAIAPMLLAIALAIKATSSGPVFYRSERIGRDGRPFGMFKFRSMYVEPEVHIEALLEPGEDPRLTQVGNLIRRYRLDELPQFLNVLRGEMGIVGPRPQVRLPGDPVTGEVSGGLLMRPGVTGLWPVRGRSYLTPEDAMRLDLSYVENWSALLDLLMIVKTIGAVSRGQAL